MKRKQNTQRVDFVTGLLSGKMDHINIEGRNVAIFVPNVKNEYPTLPHLLKTSGTKTLDEVMIEEALRVPPVIRSIDTRSPNVIVMEKEARVKELKAAKKDHKESQKKEGQFNNERTNLMNSIFSREIPRWGSLIICHNKDRIVLN